MSDSWFYLHQGTTHGPVTARTLRELAAEGKLAPTDLVWAKGDHATLAVPAHKVISFSSGPSPTAVPDWLEDVRRAENAIAPSVRVPVQGRSRTPSQVKPAPAPPVGSPGEGLLGLGSATTPGVVRTCNEDSFLVLHGSWANLNTRHEMAIVVVADGMGGHQAGDRASGLVIGSMGKALAPQLAEASAGSSAAKADALADAIDRAFAEAHKAVLTAANADAGCTGMGATGVALVVQDDAAHIGLVGDCRVYHQRGNHLVQITRDQTLVARMVELGQLTPEEAVHHPRSNEVTQAIGLRASVQPARYKVMLQPGDWLIAACDGLYAHVENAMLQEVIGQWTGSADGLAHHLVEMTNKLGGSDNCTVVALRYHGVRHGAG